MSKFEILQIKFSCYNSSGNSLLQNIKKKFKFTTVWNSRQNGGWDFSLLSGERPQEARKSTAGDFCSERKGSSEGAKET